MNFYYLLVLLMFCQNARAVEITVWEHEKEEIQDVLDGLSRDFEKENAGTKIKRSHYKTEDLRTQFQTAAMGGGGPDIVLGPNDFAGPLSVMGLISPVNELVTESLFYPEVVTAAKSDGKLWGIPISRGNHLMLFVNKKLIPKAPTTIEDMITEAKKVTKGPVFGLAYNLTEPFWFVTFMSAYGEPILKDGKPQLDNSAMTSALELVSDMKFKDKIVPADCDYTCADTLFLEGKAAMTINGDWTMAKYMGALKENLIIAPLPKSAKTGKFMQPMVSGKYVFFNSRSKGPKHDAAVKYGKFLASEKSQEAFALKGIRLPALTSLGKNKALLQNKELAASQAALANGQPMPMDVAMRAVWDAIRPQLQAVMAGRAKAKIAAAAMQKDADSKVKEMKQ